MSWHLPGGGNSDNMCHLVEWIELAFATWGLGSSVYGSICFCLGAAQKSAPARSLVPGHRTGIGPADQKGNSVFADRKTRWWYFLTPFHTLQHDCLLRCYVGVSITSTGPGPAKKCLIPEP